METNLTTAGPTLPLDGNILVVMRVLAWINGVVFLYVAAALIGLFIFRFKKSGQRCSDVINAISAFAGLMVFLRVIPLEEMLDLSDDLTCSILVALKTVTYGFALVSIWMILWIRQRVFYQSPALEHLTSFVTRAVSAATGVVLILGLIGTQAMYFATQKYHGTMNGCVLEEESYASFLWIIIYSSGFIMELCLFLLFIYPLVKHRMAMRKYAGKTSTSEPSVNIVIKRAAICAAVCIVMNAITALTKYLLPASLIVVLTYVHDVNIGVELVAVVFSFKNWKMRLFPWVSMLHKTSKSKIISYTA